MINMAIGYIYGDYKIGTIDGEVLCYELNVWTEELANKPDTVLKTGLLTRHKP